MGLYAKHREDSGRHNIHGIQERLRKLRDVLKAAGGAVDAPTFKRRANLYRPPATSEDSAALRQEAHGFHGVFENVLRQRGAAKRSSWTPGALLAQARRLFGGIVEMRQRPLTSHGSAPVWFRGDSLRSLIKALPLYPHPGLYERGPIRDLPMGFFLMGG